MEAWQPVQAAAVAPHRRRKFFIAAAVVVIVGLFVGFGIREQLILGSRTMQIDLRLDATKQSVVGGESNFTVSVTNHGPDIKNFVIFVGVEGKPGWFANHAVLDSGRCVPRKSVGRFDCGPITKGSSEVFVIRGRTTGRSGTYENVFNYEDDRGDGRPYVTPIQDTWKETVRS